MIKNSCALARCLRIISFSAAERLNRSSLRSFRGEMLSKSIRSWMMYPKSYPMGFVIHESLWWQRSAGSFSIPLTPPSEQIEVFSGVRMLWQKRLHK